ncbi:hypothetical protein IFR05_013369 [Cadophora sp. M221]|nr:hypothetical protein IFR05_013369 [Cadophora sp. M221]
MVDNQEPRRGRSGTRSNPSTRVASILQVVVPLNPNSTSSSPPLNNPPTQDAPPRPRARPGRILSLPTKKGARGKAKEKAADSNVPDIYQDMLWEALVTQPTSSERPLKKRGRRRSQVASAEAAKATASDEASKSVLAVPPGAVKITTGRRKQKASENPYSIKHLGDDGTVPEPNINQTKAFSLRSMTDEAAPTATRKPASKSRPVVVLKLNKAGEATASEDLQDAQSLQQPVPDPTRTGRLSRSKTKPTDAETETERQLPAKLSSDVPTLADAPAGLKSKAAKPASFEVKAQEPTETLPQKIVKGVVTGHGTPLITASASATAMKQTPLSAQPPKKPTSFKSGSAPLIVEPPLSSDHPTGTVRPPAAITLPSTPRQPRGMPNLANGPSTQKSVARGHTGPNLGAAGVQTMVPATSGPFTQQQTPRRVPFIGSLLPSQVFAPQGQTSRTGTPDTPAAHSNQQQAPTLGNATTALPPVSSIMRSDVSFNGSENMAPAPFNYRPLGFDSESRADQPNMVVFQGRPVVFGSGQPGDQDPIPACSNSPFQFQFGGPNRAPSEGGLPRYSPEPLPDYSNINFTSLAEKLMTNEVAMSDLGRLAPSLLDGERGTGIKNSIEEFLLKQPFRETNPGFKEFSESHHLAPTMTPSDSTLQTPPSSQQTPPIKPNQPQLLAPQIPPHFNNTTRSMVPTYPVVQGPSNPPYQQASIPQLQVPTHTQELQPSEYLQPFQGNAFFNTPYRAPQATQSSAVPPPVPSNMVLPAQPGLTGPQGSSKAAGNSQPSRPVNETAQQPPANPAMPLPSSMQFQRSFSPPSSGMTGNGASAALPKESGSQQQATPRTQSAPLPRPTRPLKTSGTTGKGAANRREHESAKVLGVSPNTRCAPLPGPTPPTKGPKVAQQSSKQLKEARHQSLKLPRRRPTVVVSRQHVELDPPQVKIKRDDVDTVLHTIAREYLEMDVGQACILNQEKYTLILNDWQDKSGYVHIDFLPVSYSAQNGDDVGRIIARRAVETDRHWVLPAVGQVMENLEKGAANGIAFLTAEDHAEFAEWGMASWKYTQLTAKAFFGHAKEVISKRLKEDITKELANRKVVAAAVPAPSAGVGGAAGRVASGNTPARELIYKGSDDGGDDRPADRLAFGGGETDGFEFPSEFFTDDQGNPVGGEDMRARWPPSAGFRMDPPDGGPYLLGSQPIPSISATVWIQDEEAFS